MAQVCANCGKKIGVFSNDYISIGDYYILCADCASPIAEDMKELHSKRYTEENAEEFSACEDRILSSGAKTLNETALKQLKKYVGELDPMAEARREKEAREKMERETAERIVIERENQKREAERRQRELDEKIENLRGRGLDGYYEYKVVALYDGDHGGIDVGLIEAELNQLGLNGWHLKCAYSNEVGKNSNSSGFGGITTGTNSTIDQNVLIFERFVRI